MPQLPGNFARRPLSSTFPSDRRAHAPRKSLVHRICSEFNEMPGLCLTTAQASRLFSLEQEVCARVFSELVEGGVLVLTHAGRYRLRPPAA
jgi:hypothetical protein